MTAYRFDDVRVDTANFRVWKAERPVRLEPKAFEVLLFLLESGGGLVGKAEIQQAVWKDTFVTENALTRLIAQLRKGLGDDAREAKYIETVPTRGYRFVAEVGREGGPVSGGPGPEGRGGRRFERRNALAAAALFALAGLGGWLWWRPSPPEPPGYAGTEVRRFPATSSSGLDDYPSFSPDGGSLAFSSDRGGSFEVYVRALAPAAREVAVTSDGQNNTEPAWSPDGRWIAYHSMGRGGIWVVPALGGQPRNLTTFGSRPVWSPDGSTLAFQSDPLTDVGMLGYSGPASTVWLVPSQGGSPRQLTRLDRPQGGHGSPAWLAGGKRVAFAARGQVWSVPARGGEPEPVATQPGVDAWDVASSGDGRSLFWGGKSRNGWHVFREPLSAETGMPVGPPVEIANGGDLPRRHLVVSRDGRRLSCALLLTRGHLMSVRLTPSGEPSATVNLTPGLTFRKSSPSFSRDGSRLSFVLWKPGEGANIWVTGADGSNPTQITSRPAVWGAVGWLPDGRRVAFASPGAAGSAVWAVDVTSGQETLLFETDVMAAFPRLDPTGRSLIFQAPNRGILNVWTVDLPGGAARPLTSDDEGIGWPAFSPDGRQLALEMLRNGNAQVGVMPRGGGTPRQLTNGPGQSWPQSWSPDGKRIVFAGQRGGVWNVFWVDVASGQQRQLSRYERANTYVRYPAWSPRGNQIAYEYAETTGNVWVMDLTPWRAAVGEP